METICYANLPLLFNRVGHFLNQLGKLKALRSEQKEKEFLKLFDKLFIDKHSPSDADAAQEAYEVILNTLYYDREARACRGGSTKMG